MKKLLSLAVCCCSALLMAAPTEVKVTDFAPDRNDATAAIQKALDSGAKRVIVDYPGFDYIIKTIFPKSDQEIILKDKVVIKAIKGGHHVYPAHLVVMDGVKNITFRGEGNVELKMNKADYQDSKQYKPSEHRHLFCIVGCENITVKNIKVSSSGGDGFYISGNKDLPASHKVTLDSVISDDHHRQGCSVISAKDLVIKNSRFINTYGTPPACGIDFEPNNGKQYLVNCLVENCDFINNQGGGGGGGIHHTLAYPVSITFRNCRFTDNLAGGFGCWPGGDKVGNNKLTGEIILENCTISGNKNEAILINNQRDGGFKITFRGCTVDNRKGTSPLIVLNSFYSDDICNIDFGDLKVTQPLNRDVIISGEMSGVRFRNITGKISITDPAGGSKVFDAAQWARTRKFIPKVANFNTAAMDTQKAVPVKAQGKAVWTPTLRGEITAVAYASPERPAELEFDIIFSRWGYNIPVTVTDSNGTPVPVDRFVVNAKNFKYKFVPKFAGVFNFTFRTPCGVKLRALTPGWGILCSKRMGLMGDQKYETMYFKVPGDAKEFMLEAFGDLGERVACTVLNGAFKKVGELDYKYGTRHLTILRQVSAEPEVYTIRVRGQEDHALTLGIPAEAILYTDPANMLKVK